MVRGSGSDYDLNRLAGRVAANQMTLNSAWAELAKLQGGCERLMGAAAICRQTGQLRQAGLLAELATGIQYDIKRAAHQLRVVECDQIARSLSDRLFGQTFSIGAFVGQVIYSIVDRSQLGARSFRCWVEPSGQLLWIGEPSNGSTVIGFFIRPLNSVGLDTIAYQSLAALLEPSRQAIITARGRAISQLSALEWREVRK
jgi:hypothetical protein